MKKSLKEVEEEIIAKTKTLENQYKLLDERKEEKKREKVLLKERIEEGDSMEAFITHTKIKIKQGELHSEQIETMIKQDNLMKKMEEKHKILRRRKARKNTALFMLFIVFMGLSFLKIANWASFNLILDVKMSNFELVRDLLFDNGLLIYIGFSLYIIGEILVGEENKTLSENVRMLGALSSLAYITFISYYLTIGIMALAIVSENLEGEYFKD